MTTRQIEEETERDKLEVAAKRERLLSLIGEIESTPHVTLPTRSEDSKFIEVRDHAYTTNDLGLQTTFSMSRHYEIRERLANNLNPHRGPLESLLEHAKPEDKSWDDLREAGFEAHVKELSSNLITAIKRNLRYVEYIERTPNHVLHARAHSNRQRVYKHGLYKLRRCEGTTTPLTAPPIGHRKQ